MNGPQHYAEAERLLDGPINVAPSEYDELRRDNLAAARVHATLALAAATLDVPPGPDCGLPNNWREWEQVTA